MFSCAPESHRGNHTVFTRGVSWGSLGCDKFLNFACSDGLFSVEEDQSGVLWNALQLGSVQCFSHGWTGLWAVASCQSVWYHRGLSPLTLNPRLRLCLPGWLLWVLWGVTRYSPVYIEVLGRKLDALGGPVEGNGVTSVNPALDMSVRTRRGKSLGPGSSEMFSFSMLL